MGIEDEYTAEELDAVPALAAEPEPELPAVEPEPEPEPKAKAPKIKATATATATATNLPASAPGQAVTGEVDLVEVSRCEYKAKQRKSLSVHHVQRRLAECGYKQALRDRDGWLADYTRDAIGNFQLDNALEPTGVADKATLELLFSNDPNVKVVD